MRTLKEIALDLLRKYIEDEYQPIYEHSGDLVTEMNELRESEKIYKQEIEDADKREHEEVPEGKV